MKFCVPHAQDDAQAERVLSSVAEFISVPRPSLAKRIRKITWQHNGVRYAAEVGSPVHTYFGGEEVLVILENPQCYFVCTANRGVVRGGPIMVGKVERTAIVLFDPPSEPPENT